MSEFLQLVRDPEHRGRFERMLRFSATKGDAAQVRERLSWGIDPNCASKTGRTPLICNVRGSCPNAATVIALLEGGAEPKQPGHLSLTPLDYANRKLAKMIFRKPAPIQKSPALDENNHLILSPGELEMFEELRRENPEIAKEFIETYMKQRLTVARRVMNDPQQVERIVEILRAAQ